MSSRIFFISENPDWKKAYMAVVLEKDRVRLQGLIQEARKKLSDRLHELRVSGPVPCDEIEAIYDALYFIQALNSSLGYRGEAGEWTGT